MLLLALAPVLVFALVLLRHRWIPVHDTLQITENAHYLWSSVAHSHVFPSWDPHVTYGRPTHVSFLSFLPPSVWLMSPIGLAFSRANAVTLVYLSQLLNEVLLVSGMVALGSLIYKRRVASLFAAVTAGGTAFWAVQMNFNFLIVYSVPACLYLVLRGLREERPWLVLAAVWVFAVTGSIGDGLYPAIFQGLTLAALSAALAWRERVSPRRMLAASGWREAAMLGLIAVALVVPAVYLLRDGLPAVTSQGREAGGGISYRVFLSYQADPMLEVFDGLTSGITLHIDLTSYAGVLMPPLVLTALLFGGSEVLPWLVAAVALFLVTLAEGSFAAPLAYLVPGVSFYRHLSYVAPHVKLMLIILSGFGIDALRDTPLDNPLRLRVFAGLLVLTAIAFELQTGAIPFTAPRYPFRREALCLLGLVASLVAVARAFSQSGSTRALREGMPHSVCVVLVIVAAVDTYSHKSAMHHRRQRDVSPEQWALFNLRPLEYQDHRVENPLTVPRYRQYAPIIVEPPVDSSLEMLRRCTMREGSCRNLRYAQRMGTPYDGTDPFLGYDACNHLGLTHHALPATLSLIQSIWSIYPWSRDTGTPIPPATRWVIGCERPKLQWFSADGAATTEGAQARLALSPEAPSDARPGSLVTAPASHVASFSPQRLELALDQPAQSPLWLYYADAWHRRWEAVIDGRPAALYRANEAFKAVLVPRGARRVEFVYRNGADTAFALIFWLESATLFGVLGWWVARASRDAKRPPEQGA